MPIKTAYDHEKQVDLGRMTLVWTPADKDRFRVYDGDCFRGWQTVTDSPRPSWLGTSAEIRAALVKLGAINAQAPYTPPPPPDEPAPAPAPKKKPSKKSK